MEIGKCSVCNETGFLLPESTVCVRPVCSEVLDLRQRVKSAESITKILECQLEDLQKSLLEICKLKIEGEVSV